MQRVQGAIEGSFEDHREFKFKQRRNSSVRNSKGSMLPPPNMPKDGEVEAQEQKSEMSDL